MTTTSTWTHLTPDHPTAHRIEPAGGDNVWRTGCGRTVRTAPTPAADTARKCGRCLAQADGTQARPVIHP